MLPSFEKMIIELTWILARHHRAASTTYQFTAMVSTSTLYQLSIGWPSRSKTAGHASHSALHGRLSSISSAAFSNLVELNIPRISFTWSIGFSSPHSAGAHAPQPRTFSSPLQYSFGSSVRIVIGILVADFANSGTSSVLICSIPWILSDYSFTDQATSFDQISSRPTPSQIYSRYGQNEA